MAVGKEEQPGFTVDNVKAAISSLYAIPPSSDLPRVNNWLIAFQAQPVSWEICANLILETGSDVLVTFAGQMLRRKIQNKFDDLQPSMYDYLRDALLAGIRMTSYSKNRSGVTQVCLALSGMYMKIGTWEDFVGDLFPKLNDSTENTMKFIVLVTLLLQDLKESTVKISVNRRTAMVSLLQNQATMLLDLTTQMFYTVEQDPADCVAIMQAFAAYISVILSSQDALKSKLMEVAFNLMASPSVSNPLHRAATECIAEVLCKIEDVQTFQEGEDTPLGFVYSKVSSFRPAFLDAMEKKNVDRMINFTRVYVELAKDMTMVMIVSSGTNQQAMKPVGWLLDAMEFHNYKILETSAEFWYYFSEMLYQSSDNTQCANAFRALIARLISMFLRQCRFQADFDGVPPDLVELDEFRVKVSEIVKDVVFIIGSNKLLEQLFKLMQEKQGWEFAECALFLMSCFVGNCLSFADEVLDTIVRNIVVLQNEAPLCLWYTATVFLCEISEWFETKPDLVESAYIFLMRCLALSPNLAQIACIGLWEFCRDCGNLLVPHCGDIINTLFASLNPSVSEDIPLELTKCVVGVIMWLPDEERSARLHCVASRFCDDLMKEFTVEPTVNGNFTLHLDRLSTLLLNLMVSVPEDKLHPLKESSMQIYETVTKTIELNASSSTVSERGCRTLRYLIRCLGVHSLPLLENLALKTFAFYQLTAHSCFLYLASILIDEFGADQRLVPGFLKMLQVLVPRALQVLQSCQNKKEMENTVEDLYRLAMRFTKKAPTQMYSVDFFEPLFTGALEALKVDDLDAFESTIKFLDEVLVNAARLRKISGKEVQSIIELIALSGDILVHNVVSASVKLPSHPWYRRLAELLHSVKKLYPQEFEGWMNSTYLRLSTGLLNDKELAALRRVLESMSASNTVDEMKKLFHDLSNIYNLTFSGKRMSFGPREDQDNTEEEEEEQQQQVDLSKVRKQWQEVEDFSLARRLQEDEFQRHYNCNREERQHMGADVRLSKQEQLAEECRYRLERLKQEQEDEKLAAQLQRQLDTEDRERRSRLEIKDHDYAKNLTDNCNCSPPFSPPQSATTGYSSASEMSMTSPSDNSPLLNLLEGSARERCMRSTEQSDYELALRLQKEEDEAIGASKTEKGEHPNEPAPLRSNVAERKFRWGKIGGSNGGSGKEKLPAKDK
uniref:CCDC50_N domain-containing protein n=1 Tax=Trichuris muris TaxID=70415 RepID=A0A5S6Q749_TRIMR